jgi:ssDNA-binding Zn-finger/Zn-ribbon topoisomerase 1
MADIRRFTTEVVEYFRDLTPEEVRAQRAEIGPCPNGDGIIRENRAAYGCSSWKSKEEPGCGFVIWKQQKGRSISPAEARDLLEHGQTELLDGFKTRPSRARLVLAEGNHVQLVADDGTRLDAPAGPRETIAKCPKCDGDIRENSRAYGCSSWKSRKEPGCGFVIWKSTKGRQISADEARQVIEQGASDWMDFKDRKGSFRGRLVLTPENTVEVQREDEPAETQAA